MRVGRSTLIGLLHQSPANLPFVLPKLVDKYCLVDGNDLPDNWAMPDDLNEKINEVLIKKSVSLEDELVNTFSDMVRDNAVKKPAKL